MISFILTNLFRTTNVLPHLLCLIIVVSSTPLPFSPIEHDLASLDQENLPANAHITKEVSHVTYEVSEKGVPPIVSAHLPPSLDQNQQYFINPKNHHGDVMARISDTPDERIEILEPNSEAAIGHFEVLPKPQHLIQNEKPSAQYDAEIRDSEVPINFDTARTGDDLDYVNIDDSISGQKSFEEMLEQVAKTGVEKMSEIVEDVKEKSKILTSDVKPVDEIKEPVKPVKEEEIKEKTVINTESQIPPVDKTETDEVPMLGSNRQSRVFVEDYEEIPIDNPDTVTGEQKDKKDVSPDFDKAPPVVAANEPSKINEDTLKTDTEKVEIPNVEPVVDESQVPDETIIHNENVGEEVMVKEETKPVPKDTKPVFPLYEGSLDILTSDNEDLLDSEEPSYDSDTDKNINEKDPNTPQDLYTDSEDVGAEESHPLSPELEDSSEHNEAILEHNLPPHVPDTHIPVTSIPDSLNKEEDPSLDMLNAEAHVASTSAFEGLPSQDRLLDHRVLMRGTLEPVAAPSPNSHLGAGAISAIVIGILLSMSMLLVASGYVYYQRRHLNRPKELKSDRSCANSDSGGYIDDQCRVSYVNSQLDIPKDKNSHVIPMENMNNKNSTNSVPKGDGNILNFLPKMEIPKIDLHSTGIKSLLQKTMGNK